MLMLVNSVAAVSAKFFFLLLLNDLDLTLYWSAHLNWRVNFVECESFSRLGAILV